MQHRLHIEPVWTCASKPTPTRTRSRLLYALLAVAVVAAGLFWRSGLIPLPPEVSKYGGDVLWALMVFVGLGFRQLLPTHEPACRPRIRHGGRRVQTAMQQRGSSADNRRRIFMIFGPYQLRCL